SAPARAVRGCPAAIAPFIPRDYAASGILLQARRVPVDRWGGLRIRLARLTVPYLVHLSRHLDRRALLFGAAALALLVVLGVLVRGRLEEADDDVAAADPRW